MKQQLVLCVAPVCSTSIMKKFVSQGVIFLPQPEVGKVYTVIGSGCCSSRYVLKELPIGCIDSSTVMGGCKCNLCGAKHLRVVHFPAICFIKLNDNDADLSNDESIDKVVDHFNNVWEQA